MIKWSKDLTDDLPKICLTSSNYTSNYYPYRAFDNHNESGGDTGFGINNPTDKDYLKIDFLKKVSPSKLSFRGNRENSAAPNSILIYMSNDDKEYTFIDKIENIDNSINTKFYNFKKPKTKFRFMKLFFEYRYSSGWFMIGQIEIFEIINNKKCLLYDNKSYYNINNKNFSDNLLKTIDFKNYGFEIHELFNKIDSVKIYIKNINTNIYSIKLNNQFLNFNSNTFPVMNNIEKDLTDNISKEKIQSSNVYSNYYAYKAFDNHVESGGDTGFAIVNPTNKEYIKIELNDFYHINKFSIKGNKSSPNCPKTIKILGSIDDNEYVEIDTVKIKKEFKTQYFDLKLLNTKFKFIKFEFIELYDTSWCTIGQIELFGCDINYYKGLIKINNSIFTFKNNELIALENNDINKENFKNSVDIKYILDNINKLKIYNSFEILIMTNYKFDDYMNCNIEPFIPINELKLLDRKFNIIIEN